MSKTVLDKTTFEDDLRYIINKHSQETGGDTPDYILAKMLTTLLTHYKTAGEKSHIFLQGALGTFTTARAETYAHNGPRLQSHIRDKNTVYSETPSNFER